jgi:hypothetical protein
MGKKSAALLEKAVEVLVEKAEDSADLARAGRTAADRQQDAVNRQHLNASKLEKLSLSLADEAEILKEKMKEEESEPQPDAAVNAGTKIPQ